MSVDLDKERYKGSFISVEYAKSNKAKCKICNSLIEKGCLRIGAYYQPPQFADQYSIFKWHHLTCYKFMDDAMVDLPTYEVKDIQGFSKLKKSDQNIVQKHIVALKASGTWKIKKIKFNKQMKKDDDNEDDEYDPKPQKKVKKDSTIKSKKKDDNDDNKQENDDEHKGYSDIQYQKYCDFKEKLKDKKNDYLKDQLKNNLQSYSGYNKSQLIEKVADGLVLGAIAKCPKCFGGRPKFDLKTGTYYCRGYQDDVDYIDCETNFTFNEIQRLEWKSTD